MGILLRLGVSAVALWIATLLVSGIKLDTDSVLGQIGTLLAVAAIFGVINAVLRPIIKTVGCAFYVFTLGLIALVVNGLLFLLTSWIAQQLGLPFKVEGVWSAILGALIVGLISWAINLAIPDKKD
ncbi:MAG: phage holin family protein [Hamadaea sp.]|uniref:phage holin family protein n=1 Tax=Hamadaea sp. TaxID=2024425 RepID=UPI0017BE49CA|nr:phage holin family protein [Hamadaea sp.]NUR73287.1 phage holin family protein [Hamadaea sp.]NUT19397.1 phage holin family protein [Hamadaea sp.]